ncbi:YpmS family protein [Limosilactobacillus fastidiosus]|uniref:YpmS family protein n=1 Tax=Limosilactobacillus fastidiosus TaxID=2759855 RepID=A0A7W3YCP4_9LACO|nr:YpmS family protein [Limosilactobacillus fastidiosus]MBB1062742.1 YpmS family protein [Limosilactobacillus fastidiosus]MBB1086523.1 YpmS family protein [Limosilactobacillus fastidiosus]MCD7084845.1 YpmS family protein [Limosilactobacillus fastidiosus]MCD7085125.1 YpmS family protein [Limosilactobacillus fastidiosus]MCD7115111.1 YpmS family protein [Limosilactobacillus fastidiosus]
MVNKKKVNWWKWAFIVLVLIIVVSSGVILHRATAPASQPEMVQSTKNNDSSLVVELNRKQVNALSANYLDNFLKDNKIKYNFMVGEKYATLVGNTKFLGTKVRFAINFIPERTKQGNVLLRARGLSVGRLNIPIKFVMGYIAKNYNIPKWVSINPKKKTVLLDLNRYSKNRQLKYSAQEIDMQNGHFKFLITVPEK